MEEEEKYTTEGPRDARAVVKAGQRQDPGRWPVQARAAASAEGLGRLLSGGSFELRPEVSG